MNPTTASMPAPVESAVPTRNSGYSTGPAAPRVVNDVVAPAAPQAAPAPPVPAQAAPAAETSTMPAPNIVTNIPVHAPQAPVAQASEDTELDQIMHEVGQELKKEPAKPQKHGLLGFVHHEPKPLVKVNNQPPKPAAPPQPAVAAAPLSSEPAPAAVQAAVAAQPQPLAAPATPKTQRHVPVFVIFVTLCVAGFLVAAAITAYR